MTELFHTLLDWVALHPYWSWALIFLVSLSESLAIVGLIVPGVVIMFGIGALIAAGSIAFWPAMGWAVAGAVAGDGLSFWLGHHYRERLTAIWPFTRYPESLTRGILFFDKYGGKSVAFGRFFGPVRAVIPLVAGMMGMAPWRFLVANLLSALAWAPAYLLPGMVFGASIELASEVAFRLVLLILLLAALLWLTVWLVHHIFLLLHPHTSSLIQWMLRWGEKHPRMEGLSAAMADSDHPEAKGLSILASLLILASGMFTLILGWALDAAADPGINHMVLENLQSLRTPWADHLMLFFTGLADLETMTTLFLAVLALLLWRGRKHAALHWLAAALFCLLAVSLLKHGIQITRPSVVAGAEASYAFPSGHTLWATVIYGFLSVVLARATAPPWRWIPYSIAALLIACVALSRLYLGMHWLSDVLGSFTLGIAWVSALGIAYHRHTEAETSVWGLAATASAALLLVLSLQGVLVHERRLDWYTPVIEISEMEASHWWNEGWTGLPQFRLDSRHLREQPMNLQYAGELHQLEALLADSGWQGAPILGWNNLLKLLSPSLPLQQLPVLPQVHDGQHESLVLEKLLPEGRRMVLRLWSAQVVLLPEMKPLWIGLITEQHKVELLNLLAFAATSKQPGDALRQLTADTKRAPGSRLPGIDGPLLLQNKGRGKTGPRTED